jgi:hypothetical protein
MTMARSNGNRNFQYLLSRTKFWSSTFVLGTSTIWAATDRMEAACAADTVVSSNNPRYIEKELQMKYGEGPGTDIDQEI